MYCVFVRLRLILDMTYYSIYCKNYENYSMDMLICFVLLYIFYYSNHAFILINTYMYIYIYRRFNAIVSQLKMHYFSEGAFESLIASQLLKKEKYI